MIRFSHISVPSGFDTFYNTCCLQCQNDLSSCAFVFPVFLAMLFERCQMAVYYWGGSVPVFLDAITPLQGLVRGGFTLISQRAPCHAPYLRLEVGGQLTLASGSGVNTQVIDPVVETIGGVNTDGHFKQRKGLLDATSRAGGEGGFSMQVEKVMRYYFLGF